jgi:hypothetical protein
MLADSDPGCFSSRSSVSFTYSFPYGVLSSGAAGENPAGGGGRLSPGKPSYIARRSSKPCVIFWSIASPSAPFERSQGWNAA